MIGAALRYIGLNKVVVISAAALLASLVGTGYLLKQSYAENGKLENQIAQWQSANEAWSLAWQKREAEYLAATARMKIREADYQRIEGELNDYQEKLRNLLASGPNNDCGVRPSVWMLIKDSAAGNAAGSLPGD